MPESILFILFNVEYVYFNIDIHTVVLKENIMHRWSKKKISAKHKTTTKTTSYLFQKLQYIVISNSNTFFFNVESTPKYWESIELGDKHIFQALFFTIICITRDPIKTINTQSG